MTGFVSRVDRSCRFEFQHKICCNAVVYVVMGVEEGISPVLSIIGIELEFQQDGCTTQQIIVNHIFFLHVTITQQENTQLAEKSNLPLNVNKNVCLATMSTIRKIDGSHQMFMPFLPNLQKFKQKS